MKSSDCGCLLPMALLYFKREIPKLMLLSICDRDREANPKRSESGRR